MRMMLVVLGSFITVAEAAEAKREKINQSDTARRTQHEIAWRTQQEIADRTKRDIESHNRREMILRNLHEIRMHKQK